jgi:hypothetical protein
MAIQPSATTSENRLDVFVFTPIGGVHRILASTVEASATVRTIALEHDEGIVGFTFDLKAPVVASIEGAIGGISSRSHEVIGEQRSLRETNRHKVDPNLKWIYATPIFDAPPGVPYSDKVIGILSVDSSSESAGQRFFEQSFQKDIEAIASNVAPYLAVLQQLMTRPDDE